MGSLAKKGLDKYLSQLYQHPLRTKVITSGVLIAISDVVSQKLIGIQKLQLKRILLKMLYGCLYLGPFGHYLHQILDKIFQGKRDSRTVAKKVMVEQFTSSPWNHFVFLVYYGLVIEKRTWVQVKAKVRKEFPSVQLTAWMVFPFSHSSALLHFSTVSLTGVTTPVLLHRILLELVFILIEPINFQFWPFASWINHQYVPLQLRVIFYNLVAFCWGLFLNVRAKSLTVNKS